MHQGGFLNPPGSSGGLGFGMDMLDFGIGNVDFEVWNLKFQICSLES